MYEKKKDSYTHTQRVVFPTHTKEGFREEVFKKCTASTPESSEVSCPPPSDCEYGKRPIKYKTIEYDCPTLDRLGGGDYGHTFTDTFEACAELCVNHEKCRSFTWAAIDPNFGNKAGGCYPKIHVPPLIKTWNASYGLQSGVKIIEKTPDLSGGIPGILDSEKEDDACEVILYSGSEFNGKKQSLGLGTWFARPLRPSQDANYEWWNKNYLNGGDFDTAFASMKIPTGFKVTMNTPNKIFTYKNTNTILNSTHKEYTVRIKIENETNKKCKTIETDTIDTKDCKTLKSVAADCLGIDMNTPCDDAIYNGTAPSKDCLLYLYTNKSSENFLGSGYPFVKDTTNTSKTGTITTFCREEGSDNPKNASSHLYQLKTINEVKTYLSDLFIKASGSLDVTKRDIDGGKRNSWKRCMGIPTDKCLYGNYADDPVNCTNPTAAKIGCKPPPPPPPPPPRRKAGWGARSGRYG